jgi:hypothetical protein
LWHNLKSSEEFARPKQRCASARPLPRAPIASDPPIIGCDPAIEIEQFGLALDNQHPDQRIEAVRRSSRDLGKSTSQPPLAGDDNAVLGEHATNLIDEFRPASHQALANPMESLDRQLFG